MTQYLREDFTYEYSRRGYMIFYKGQSIGGGGILNTAKGPTGRQVVPQLLEYKKYAETAIQNILVGNPGRIYREAIEKIDGVR